MIGAVRCRREQAMAGIEIEYGEAVACPAAAGLANHEQGLVVIDLAPIARLFDRP